MSTPPIESQHTPEPWKMEILPSAPIHGIPYVEIKAGCGYASGREKGFVITGFISEADASVITASPKLLACLIHLIDRDWFREGDSGQVVCCLDADQVREALSEALNFPHPQALGRRPSKTMPACDGLQNRTDEDAGSIDLESIISYDPITGLLSWKTDRCNRAKAGSKAGFVCRSGYIGITIEGKMHLAHRVAFRLMTGRWPACLIDHVNGDRTDNRWENLRESIHSQNSWNSKRPKTNKSGHKGVYFDRSNNAWRGRVTVNGKTMSVGYFSSADEAAQKVREVRAKHHGSFSNDGTFKTGAGEELLQAYQVGETINGEFGFKTPTGRSDGYFTRYEAARAADLTERQDRAEAETGTGAIAEALRKHFAAEAGKAGAL